MKQKLKKERVCPRDAGGRIFAPLHSPRTKNNERGAFTFYILYLKGFLKMQNTLTAYERNNITNFAPAIGQEIEKSRALQEVQGAIYMARMYPRDEFIAQRKIMESAKRLSLAEKAIYSYPRGGQQVQGASIRTAETIAKYWGNMLYGIKELTQDNAAHTSDVMAYAWDMETNVRREVFFKVNHLRVSKNKYAKTEDEKYITTVLTDPRDIYEKVANEGARRVRACILGIVPTDIVEEFLAACEKTIEGNNDKPLKDRITDMLQKFEALGITKEMIEKRIGTRAENFIPKNLVDLGAVYNSIKNNFAPVDQYFDIPTLGEQQIEKSKLKVKKDNKNETDK